DYRALPRISVDEPDRFWRAVVEDLGLGLDWQEIVDLSRGPEWARWFLGATTNVAGEFFRVWAERDGEAVVGGYEDGTRDALSWRELSRQVTQLAEALVELGVRAGDRVAIFMPM